MKYLTIGFILSLLLADRWQTEAKASAHQDDALVYDENQVLAFHITIAREDWQKMQPLPPRPEQKGQQRLVFQYVPATVRFRDETYKNVGIRFKGSSSYTLAPERYKKPFKLDFDRYVEGQNFHGFTKLNFHTNASDPTMMREKLSYNLFRKAGVPAPRATFVKLYLTINGQLDDAYLGVYTSVEQIGDGFLKKHFGRSKGLFVKRIGGGDFTYRGEEWEDYENQFELESKPKKSAPSIPPNWGAGGALFQFIKLLRQAPDAQFNEEIENWLDTDELLSWLAVNTLLTNLDSYTAARHNYYLYRDLRTERFVMIPWDLSHSFGGHPFFSGTPEELANFDIYHPYPGVAPKSLIVRLLEVPRYRQRYLTRLEELIAGAFRPDAMDVEIDRLYQLIHGDVTADTRKEFPTEAFEIGVVTKVERPFRPPGLPPSIQIPVRQVPGLKSFVVERVQNVRAQLAGAEGYRVQPYSPISPEQMFEMNRQRSTVIAGLPDEYPGVQLWQIRERLGLTESQREQIETILKATAEQNRPIQTQLENLQKEVYLLMVAGKGELAQKKTSSAESLHQQRVKILAPAFERIMGVLTETQRHAFIQHQHRARPDP